MIYFSWKLKRIHVLVPETNVWQSVSAELKLELWRVTCFKATLVTFKQGVPFWKRVLKMDSFRAFWKSSSLMS